MLRLSNAQFNKLSDITANIGLISLASVALPTILEQFILSEFLLGIIVSLFFWIFSVYLIKP